MADGPNAAGTFLNENSALIPGAVDTFDDAAAPENDLLVEGTDYRDSYYQESNFLLSNVGGPSAEDGGDVNAGVMKGTLLGDSYEGYHGLTKAFGSGGSVTDKVDAISKAAATGTDWVSAAQTFGKAIKGTTTLAKFDPFNFLGTQLMTWMLEHVEPMRKSLDSITGNPDMVQAYSASWSAIAESLTTTAEQWAAALDTGIGEWVGDTAVAYHAIATELTGQIAEKAAVAQVLADCNEAMKGIVETVRGIVVEILSSLAGMLAEMTVLLIASAGTATPALIARALLDISLAATSVSQLLIELGKALISTKSMAQSAVQLVRGVTAVETAKQ
ncbi:WXG100 family type VII secretion target [Nocardia halotolerans]|uniref:WXG100 family type VII secretion target n=1 Tax=Nocardia halotolerans TaxID=1755878 RepID=A0ABV8VG73_9NOCA